MRGAVASFVQCDSDFGLVWCRSVDSSVILFAISPPFSIDASSSVLVLSITPMFPTFFLSAEEHTTSICTSSLTQGGQSRVLTNCSGNHPRISVSLQLSVISSLLVDGEMVSLLSSAPHQPSVESRSSLGVSLRFL